MRNYYEIDLRCVPKDALDDKSTLVQVMAWCRLATNLYLSQFYVTTWRLFLYGNYLIIWWLYSGHCLTSGWQVEIFYGSYNQRKVLFGMELP